MPEKPAPKRKRGRLPQLDPELVAAALVTFKGNISATAKKFGVQRASLQELISKRPALQTILKDAREGFLDDAETALYSAVLNKQAWAVCFSLKCLGKERGYIEKVDSLPAIEELLSRLPDAIRDSVEKTIRDSVQS